MFQLVHPQSTDKSLFLQPYDDLPSANYATNALHERRMNEQRLRSAARPLETPVKTRMKDSV